ncbi:MAG: hypothetical protein CM1200mP28_11900 [Deltaproteobacteria bacterium]|nr:MAG: hypothetical protein CM1200mP28_11900 [Deltaproteobacteria bacterium]
MHAGSYEGTAQEVTFFPRKEKIDKDDKILTMVSCVFRLSAFSLLIIIPFSSNFIKDIQVHPESDDH